MRSPRLLIVCALVLAPVAGMPLTTAPHAPAPPAPGAESGSPGAVVQPINNSISHLAIKPGRINNTTIETAKLDIGGSITTDRYEFQQRYHIDRFDAAYENASDKQAVISAAINRSANQSARLQARQKEVIRKYNTDEVSKQTLFRELANITAEAERISVFLSHIEKKTLKLDTRAKNIRINLRAFSGPVRTRIQSAIQGDSDIPKRFFVRTSAQGIVLATIDDREYIRQVYLGGAREGENTTQLDNSDEIATMVEKSYPTINDSNVNRNGYNTYYSYKFKVYGGILTYTDRSTMEIFYEQQRMTVSDDRTVRGPQNTSGSFALSTNVTYTGGYMYVRLTTDGGSKTVNGTITVGNETVGRTEDGELSMLQPKNGTTITATVDNETVSVTLGKRSSKPPGSTQPASVIDSSNQLIKAKPSGGER